MGKGRIKKRGKHSRVLEKVLREITPVVRVFRNCMKRVQCTGRPFKGNGKRVIGSLTYLAESMILAPLGCSPGLTEEKTS